MLGASFDTPEENRTFADAEHFGYRLLSDTGRDVGRAYEVARDAADEHGGYPMRIAYLIDPEGTIRRAYQVSDVEGFAGTVVDDLAELRGE